MDNYYLPEVEIDPKYEEQITNELLDLISILKKIF